MKLDSIPEEIKFVNELRTALNIAQFEIVFAKYGNDVKAIYDSLLYSGLDRQSKGFWILDVEHDFELFSDGFINYVEYPRHLVVNKPEFWQGIILPKYLPLVYENFDKHVATKGKHPYEQYVEYRTLYKKIVPVLCHGKIMSWLDPEKTKPKLMLGVHL